jgi:glycosyltransferase involved in cell wall biosynthesis
VVGGGGRGPFYTVLAQIARYLYRRAAGIVVLARGVADVLEGYGVDASKISYVPNGVDLDAFARSDRPPHDGFRIVYAGAHGPMNGLELVLDAAALLRDRREMEFVFAGDGPARPALEQRAQELGLANVKFLGTIPKAKMPALLASADAGLMVLRDAPLFAYGVSPNKLFDYLGAALPVICNVPGDVAQMLREADAGEQAMPGSAESLANAAVRLADRAHVERLAMGERGRAWVSREHARPILAERLDHALRKVL